MDQGTNGCIVKSVSSTGAVAKDGRLQVGDYVVAMNNESLRHVSSAQVRAILRRATLQTDLRYSQVNATYMYVLATYMCALSMYMYVIAVPTYTIL